jgi:tetratricopeptide (TPR) repeat protein
LLNRRNLLEVRLSQAEYRRVVEYSAELLRTASALDGHVNRAYVHLYSARAFHELADYRSSKFHLDRVVELLDAVSDPALSTQYHILQAERRLRLGDREGCTRNLVLALAATDKSGDPRDRAEVYLAAAKAEQTAGQMPPEFFAAGAEAHRLFEKTGLAHRVFEVVLATDDPTLAVFLSRFPLPEGLDNPTTLSYSGPPALQGMWLWRLAEKALAEKATMPTIQFFSAVVEWCQEHGTAELKRRALTELGVLYHQIRDWELAACSFTAAVQELEAVASTIDAPAEREAYLSAGDVRRLNQQVAAFSTHFA